MTRDKWLNLLDTVEAKFGIDRNYKEDLGKDIPGEKQVVEFIGPIGKIKLEWVEKARLVDEKTTYSNRIGSQVKINKIYSEDEKVNYINAYKWDEIREEWNRVDKGMFDI